jgi:hypothetical protein
VRVALADDAELPGGRHVLDAEELVVAGRDRHARPVGRGEPRRRGVGDQPHPVEGDRILPIADRLRRGGIRGAEGDEPEADEERKRPTHHHSSSVVRQVAVCRSHDAAPANDAWRSVQADEQ